MAAADQDGDAANHDRCDGLEQVGVAHAQ